MDITISTPPGVPTRRSRGHPSTDESPRLDKFSVRCDHDLMLDVAVISDPAAAESALHGVRSRLLAELSAPDSASAVGSRLGLPRQQVNYHLKELERFGLIEFVEERRKGNCVERIVQATARSYVISPSALTSVAPDPTR